MKCEMFQESRVKFSFFLLSDSSSSETSSPRFHQAQQWTNKIDGKWEYYRRIFLRCDAIESLEKQNKACREKVSGRDYVEI